MQDGEVKGTEMHISFDVCSTVMPQLLSLSPPPSDGVAREGGGGPGVPVITPSPFASLLCHIKKTRRWEPSIRHSVNPPFKNPSYAPGLSSFPLVIDLTASLPWVAWRVCSASPLYPPFLHFSTMILIALSFPRCFPCSLLQMVIHSTAALRSRLSIHLTIPNKSLWLIFFIRS